jgi:hypothetical protein
MRCCHVMASITRVKEVCDTDASMQELTEYKQAKELAEKVRFPSVHLAICSNAKSHKVVARRSPAADVALTLQEAYLSTKRLTDLEQDHAKLQKVRTITCLSDVIQCLTNQIVACAG